MHNLRICVAGAVAQNIWSAISRVQNLLLVQPLQRDSYGCPSWEECESLSNTVLRILLEELNDLPKTGNAQRLDPKMPGLIHRTKMRGAAETMDLALQYPVWSQHEAGVIAYSLCLKMLSILKPEAIAEQRVEIFVPVAHQGCWLLGELQESAKKGEIELPLGLAQKIDAVIQQYNRLCKAAKAPDMRESVQRGPHVPFQAREGSTYYIPLSIVEVEFTESTCPVNPYEWFEKVFHAVTGRDGSELYGVEYSGYTAQMTDAFGQPWE